jgi:hypothetical protein
MRSQKESQAGQKEQLFSPARPRSAKTLRSAVGRSERRGEAYVGSYVEPLSDARTQHTVLFTSRKGGK